LLQLEFHATGYRQHVFRRADIEDDWVYKVPASFGHLVAYTRARRVGRITSAKKTVLWTLIEAPRKLGGRLLRGSRAAATLADWRERMLLSYDRVARRRNFREMLALIRALHAYGLDHIVLPYEILSDAEAVLRINGAGFAYRGPMLRQRRADVVLNKQALPPFDWHEVVAAQHALWRHGFGLTEKGEVLGYRSWALLNGRICLADTSSLVRDRRRARRTLDPARLDEQQRLVLDFHSDPVVRATFAEYFGFIRAEVNLEWFDRVWSAPVSASA
jgi:hypothetical protein